MAIMCLISYYIILLLLLCAYIILQKFSLCSDLVWYLIITFYTFGEVKVTFSWCQ